jgi:hypothetical protein
MTTAPHPKRQCLEEYPEDRYGNANPLLPIRPQLLQHTSLLPPRRAAAPRITRTHCTMLRPGKRTASDKCTFRPCCLDTRTHKDKESTSRRRARALLVGCEIWRVAPGSKRWTQKTERKKTWLSRCGGWVCMVQRARERCLLLHSVLVCGEEERGQEEEEEKKSEVIT